MKALFLIILWAPLYVMAEEASSTAKDGRTIVIQDAPGKMLEAPKVFVESGHEDITSSPEDSLKAAYRQWSQKCDQWKSELRHMNGNNLMVASCGTAKKTIEKINSENVYTYSSTGTYKIKVLGK